MNQTRYHDSRIGWLLFIFLLLTKSHVIEPSEHDLWFSSSTSGDSPRDLPSNISSRELAAVLRHRGYRVLEFAEGPPLALIGDMAYPPEKVLPELLPPPEPRAESNIKHRKNLWLDKNGNAQAYYYYETNGGADKTLFEKAVKSWADSTCITFTKLSDGKCDKKFNHGAVCVGAHNGCWSTIGNLYTYREHSTQRMSVEEGCELHAVAHEFGHALGLQHTMGRPDRDEFIWVNNYNFEVPIGEKTGDMETKVKNHWAQGAKCKHGQMFEASAPIPYDFNSLMEYGQSDFADGDYRLIFSARNAYHTYMMDYKRSGGYLQTHYDKFIVNTAYKCVEKWTAACKKSGKPHPKCKHNGYLTKACKCACPHGYVGSSCETKKGKLFPIRDRATAQLYIVNPGKYGLENRGMHTTNKNYPNSDFIYYQYAVLVAKGKPHTVTSTLVYVSEKVTNSWTMKAGKILSFFQDISKNDCLFGMLFYWGQGSQRHMRTECMSTFVRNEPPSEAVTLRSRDHELSINIIAQVGTIFNYAEFTKWMLEETKFTYSWPPRPQDHLTLLTKPAGQLLLAGGTTVKGADKLIADAAAGNGTTESGATFGKTGALLASSKGRAVGAGVGAALVLLLILAGLGFYVWRSRYHPDSVGDKPAKGLGESSSSSSSSSSSDSD